MPNICVSLAYCLETTLPLKRKMTSSIARCLEGLYNFENILFRISNRFHVFHSLSEFSSILSTSFLLSLKCKNEGCVNICLISRCYSRVCNRSPLSHILLAGLTSSVPFLLLLPGTETFQLQPCQVEHKVPCPNNCDISSCSPPPAVS